MTFAAELREKRRAAICRFMCGADTCKAWPKCYTVLAKIEAADAECGAVTVPCARLEAAEKMRDLLGKQCDCLPSSGCAAALLCAAYDAAKKGAG